MQSKRVAKPFTTKSLNSIQCSPYSVRKHKDMKLHYLQNVEINASSHTSIIIALAKKAINYIQDTHLEKI